ncbi:hypothetical protein Taro_044348 [Colocasia esculenta]|uniref:Uncharacterized protein n=1 Tax=Colocasia esculenta TaxID=4460 RepID=A0A843X0M2_COLES|nr:hypothetical protein [Colocasia esculenta]
MKFLAVVLDWFGRRLKQEIFVVFRRKLLQQGILKSANGGTGCWSCCIVFLGTEEEGPKCSEASRKETMASNRKVMWAPGDSYLGVGLLSSDLDSALLQGEPSPMSKDPAPSSWERTSCYWRLEVESLPRVPKVLAALLLGPAGWDESLVPQYQRPTMGWWNSAQDKMSSSDNVHMMDGLGYSLFSGASQDWGIMAVQIYGASIALVKTGYMRVNEDCTMESNRTSFASCKIQSPVSSARLPASLLAQKDDEKENYEHYGISASCETGASVSSSTLANGLLSPNGTIDRLLHGTPRLCYSGENNENEMEVQSTPTGSIDPCVNETSRHCCSREDNEMEMEVHSTKISLDLDNNLKEIACGSDKVSCTVPTSSRPLEAIEISKTDIWGEETEREREVHSTTMNSDDCRRETTSIFRTSQQGSGKEEDTEIQSIDMDDADRRDMMSSSDNTLIATGGSLLPPVEFMSAEMNEASTQSCTMEVTECGSEIQPTIKNLLDLDTAANDTTRKIAKSFVTLDALSFPGACHSPETNDMSTEKLVTRNTEKEVQSMNIIVDAEDGKKAISNSLDKALESHVVVSPSDKDEHSFRQLAEGLRITENHHPSEAAEVNAIEESVLELEELANKIKWLKGLLIFGLQWSNAMKPTWKFSET